MARASSARRASTAAAPSAVTHISYQTLFRVRLTLQAYWCKECSKYIPCESSRRLLIKAMSSSAISSFRCSLVTSEFRAVAGGGQPAFQIKPRLVPENIFSILRSLPLEGDPSLRGYCIHNRCILSILFNWQNYITNLKTS